MSENNKVGIDIQSTYKGEGTQAAIADQQKLADATKKQQADLRAALEAEDRFKADIAERARQRAEREAAAAQRALEKETNAISNAARETIEQNKGIELAAMAGRVAMVASVAAAAGLAVATVKLGSAWAKSADEVGTLSEKTRISVEELSVMRLESEETNTSLEKLGTGYKNLSVKMFEANSGNKQSQALFKALGVEYSDTTGRLRNARDVMDDVATAMAGMTGEAEKSAIASKLLGRGIGEDLMNYLNQGGEKLRGFREEAEKLGLKMDSETVKAVKDLKDNINILMLSAEGAAGELAGPFFQSLVKITQAMRVGAKEGGVFGAVLRGIGKTTDEMIGPDSSPDALRSRAARTTADIKRMEEAQRTNPNSLRQPQIDALYSQLQDLYRQIGESEGSGVEDVPAKRAAPSNIVKDGNKKTGGSKKSREQVLLEQDNRNWVKHADQVFADADRENLENAKDADKRARDAEKEADAIDKLARKYRDLIDPMQPLRRELADLEKLFAAGKITSDEYTEGLFNVQDRMEGLNVKTKELKNDGLEEFKNAIHGWGRESSREIGRMMVDGEFDLKRLGNAFKNLAADILAAQVQKQWMDPLMKAGTGWLEGVLGGGGGSGVPGWSTPGIGDFLSGATIAHNGGVIGGSSLGGRYVHPAYFENAPRMHRGGIAGDEVLTILQREEEVLTRNDPRHRYNGGGTGNVRVEIINQGQPQEVASAKPTFDAQGMVVQIVLRDLNTGGPIRGAVEALQRPAM